MRTDTLLGEASKAIASGDLASAERLVRQGVSADPQDPSARLLLGFILARSRRLSESVEHFEAVLAIDPNCGEAAGWLGDTLRKLGRPEEALEYAVRAGKLNPSDPSPIFTVGMCLVALGRYPEAEKRLRRAIAFGRAAMPLHYLGVALMRQDKLEEALKALQEAQRLEPNQPIHAVAIGQIELIRGDFGGAVASARRALDAAPNDASANLLMAEALSGEGNAPAAETYIRTALAADPNSAEAHGQLGIWLQQMGRFAEAETHIEQSLSLNPDQPSVLFYKTQGKKVPAEENHFIERMLRLEVSDRTPAHEKIILGYALGKAYDDLGQPGEAMKHYNFANEVSCDVFRQADPWVAEELTSFVDETIRTYTEHFLQRWAKSGNPSERPIFVLGMIRSGTTLMEQMLSAHPHIEGAGELSFWLNEREKCIDPHTRELVPGAMSELSARYLERLDQTSETARFVTDKMPGNATIAGIIHACLPNARIIHMDRDPIDIALSIWTTFIRNPPRFGGDKRHIVETLRQHDRLRDHWSRVIPSDRFLRVRYEELTAEPERVMRQVLEFCGLEWEPACVRPEDNRRFVSTPSLWRVHRPVDTSSVNKKARFGPYLGEFASLE
jgi:tetratricopeptide (TPR) repeat protein